MSDGEEAGTAARLGLIGVDRHAVVVAAPRMGHVIGASADRAAAPRIVDIEGEGRMHADGGVQRVRCLPGAIAYARDVFAGRARGAQRQLPAIAGDDVALVVQPGDLDLQALHR